MLKEKFLQIYNEGNENASNLLNSAKLLFEAKFYSQAYTLAFSALEEISKAQFAADVFTGLRTKEEFKEFHRDHRTKIKHIGWAYKDASSYPFKYKLDGPELNDLTEMSPERPLFKKRQAALFVDIDLDSYTISTPKEAITQKDADDIIHITEVAFHRIWEVTGEFGGNRIGTKGFLK